MLSISAKSLVSHSLSSTNPRFVATPHFAFTLGLLYSPVMPREVFVVLFMEID
jgi:hypothetical protein